MSLCISSNRNLWKWHLATFFISSHVTEGVAKILGFEVLRHGTSFSYCSKICEKGADPSFGGRTTSAIAYDESTRRQAEACKNGFYVFKDTEAHFHDSGIKIPLIGHAMKRMYTRAHAVLAGISNIKDANKLLHLFKIIIYGVANFFSPTLRFVYKKEEMKILDDVQDFENYKQRAHKLPRFIIDKDYANLAYKTPDPLSSERIGLVGLYRHDRFADVKKTITKNPGRFLLGIVQLITGIASTLFGSAVLVYPNKLWKNRFLAPLALLQMVRIVRVAALIIVK